MVTERKDVLEINNRYVTTMPTLTIDESLESQNIANVLIKLKTTLYTVFILNTLITNKLVITEASNN